jgi:hypothetical protein
MRAFGIVFALVTTLTLAAPAPGRAELKISDLDVYLNDQEVTVHVVVFGAVPDTFKESLESGIPAHIRFTVELWRYHRFWPDRLHLSRVIERSLTYNVVAKEYKVAPVKGETSAPYTTKDLRDAQRVLSELHTLKLTPASALDPTEVFYIRVMAEAALRGENTFLARMSGAAEQAFRQSDYRTIMRVQ